MHSAWHLVQENTLTNRSHYWYYYYLLRSPDIHFLFPGPQPLVVCDSELQLWWVVPEHAVHTSQVPTKSVLCFRAFPAAESSPGATKRGPRRARSCPDHTQQEMGVRANAPGNSEAQPKRSLQRSLWPTVVTSSIAYLIWVFISSLLSSSHSLTSETILKYTTWTPSSTHTALGGTQAGTDQ